MYIALCDIEDSDLKLLKDSFTAYHFSEPLRVKCFPSPISLSNSVQNSIPDLIFIAMKSSDTNGFDIAVDLRKLPAAPLIVFISNSPEYFLKGYGIAFRCISKPIDSGTVYQVIDDAIAELHAHRFCYTVDGISHYIPLCEIYYYEVCNHTTTLYSKEKSFSLRVSLNSIMAMLPQTGFGMPHRSYIVNLSQIRSSTPRSVTLANGAVIPISRRCQGEFFRKLQTFLNR